MKDLSWLCIPLIVMALIAPALIGVYTESKENQVAMENGYEQVYDTTCNCKLWKKGNK